ncbi:MAG TPA: hypothetical protein VIL85_07670 [Thermomicrobiales bacterium]|jgi:hypothetical protein
MARWQHSFLVRCRLQHGAAERVEVEHIQSGERVVFPSVTTAASWITMRSTGTIDDSLDQPHRVNSDGVAIGRAK